MYYILITNLTDLMHYTIAHTVSKLTIIVKVYNILYLPTCVFLNINEKLHKDKIMHTI